MCRQSWSPNDSTLQRFSSFGEPTGSALQIQISYSAFSSNFSSQFASHAANPFPVTLQYFQLTRYWQMVDHLNFQLKNIINGANCFVINCQRREEPGFVQSGSGNDRLLRQLKSSLKAPPQLCYWNSLAVPNSAPLKEGGSACRRRGRGPLKSGLRREWVLLFWEQMAEAVRQRKNPIKEWKKGALVLGLSLVEKKDRSKKKWLWSEETRFESSLWGGSCYTSH